MARKTLIVFAVFLLGASAASKPVHVWEKQELSFTASRAYRNPYTDAVVWVDLKGPGFNRRVYGFWDGGRRLFLLYFERGCPRSQVRGARLNSVYGAQWFNPRNGTWSDAGGGTLVSNKIGGIDLPDMPDSTDWGLKLVYRRPLNMH